MQETLHLPLCRQREFLFRQFTYWEMHFENSAFVRRDNHSSSIVGLRRGWGQQFCAICLCGSLIKQLGCNDGNVHLPFAFRYK
jgi:hypothetical protein